MQIELRLINWNCRKLQKHVHRRRTWDRTEDRGYQNNTKQCAKKLAFCLSLCVCVCVCGTMRPCDELGEKEHTEKLEGETSADPQNESSVDLH